MTLSFGTNIDIRDTVRYKNIMKEYGLVPNGGILTSLKGEDLFIRTTTVLHHHILIPHCVANIMLAPNDSVITTCSKTKIFLHLDGFNGSLNKYIIRVSK
jgi:hypothetical protein